MAGDNAQSRGPYQVAVVVAFLPLSFLTLGLRLFVRTRKRYSLGWDDWMMVVALINFVVYSTACLMIVQRYGAGARTLTTSMLEGAVNWTMVNEVFYLTTIIALKISLGLFFLRVCIERWQKNVIYATMSASTALNVFNLLFIIFMCGNPVFYFERRSKEQCIRNGIVLGVGYEQAAVSASTDLIFAVLPIPLLWHTRMDIRTKLTCGAILSLGAAGFISSIGRFFFINGLTITPDFFWKAANISIWSTAEVGTGIVAGCLATLRPLYKQLSGDAKHLSVRATVRAKRFRQSLLLFPAQKKAINGKEVNSSKQSLHEGGQVFQTWGNATRGGIHHATVIGGWHKEDDSDLERLELSDNPRKTMHLVHVRDGAESTDNFWSVDSGEGTLHTFSNSDAEILPATAISKVVDVEVTYSRNTDPANRLSMGSTIVAFPGRTSGGGPSDSRGSDDVPEWERMPDLILNSGKSRSRSSSRSGRRSRSRSRSRSPAWPFGRRRDENR